MLVALAKQLQRSPSDTVRLLIREALREMTQSAELVATTNSTEQASQSEGATTRRRRTAQTSRATSEPRESGG